MDMDYANTNPTCDSITEPVGLHINAYKWKDYQAALLVPCNLEKAMLLQKHFDRTNCLRKLGLRDQGNHSDKPK